MVKFWIWQFPELAGSPRSPFSAPACAPDSSGLDRKRICCHPWAGGYDPRYMPDRNNPHRPLNRYEQWAYFHGERYREGDWSKSEWAEYRMNHPRPPGRSGKIIEIDESLLGFDITGVDTTTETGYGWNRRISFGNFPDGLSTQIIPGALNSFPQGTCVCTYNIHVSSTLDSIGILQRCHHDSPDVFGSALDS